MLTVKEQAFAKINLYLDVTAKRPDGFHDIRSIMHTVSLCDEVTVTVSPSEAPAVSLCVQDAPYVPTDRRNLAYQAAEAFLTAGGFCEAVHIHLKKQIPTSAGMAGGSSDAAAVLRALNRIHKRVFSIKRLLQIALSIGSDVPFCLVGKTALCEGRGERMTSFPAPAGCVFVVACADEHVSTKAAYEHLDEVYSDFDGTRPTGGEAAYAATEAWLCDGSEIPRLFNVFEAPVLSLCDGARRIKEQLDRYGADATLVSGSGPSVFGVFFDEALANTVASCLMGGGVQAFVVRSVI